MTTKQCASCGQVYPIEMYYKYSYSKSGYNGTCKYCLKDQRERSKAKQMNPSTEEKVLQFNYLQINKSLKELLEDRLLWQTVLDNIPMGSDLAAKFVIDRLRNLDILIHDEVNALAFKDFDRERTNAAD